MANNNTSITSPGVDPHDFGASEWETAEWMTFNVSKNFWFKESCNIMLAPIVLHMGSQFGTVFMKKQLSNGAEKQEEQYFVCKKLLPKANIAAGELYDGVKRQAVAALCSFNFRRLSVDTLQPVFIESFVMVLQCRSCAPLVRVEQVVAGKAHKRKVSLEIVSTPQERADAHRLAAFQFFTYIQSKKKFVIFSVEKMGDDDMWSEPEIFSQGKSLGDAQDKGDEGLNDWKNKFTKIYCSLLRLTQEELFALDPREFVKRLFILGTFDIVQSPIVWQPSSSAKNCDEGVLMPSVHKSFGLIMDDKETVRRACEDLYNMDQNNNNNKNWVENTAFSGESTTHLKGTVSRVTHRKGNTSKNLWDLDG